MIKKLLLSVLAIFGFSFFLSSGDTYAAPVNLTSSQVYVCGNDTGINCSDYDSIRFTSTSASNFNSVINYTCYISSNNNPFFQIPIAENFEVVYSVYSCTAIRLNVSSYASYYTYTAELFNSSSGIIPSGTINISENGTFDVTNYASAVVDVPQTVEGEGSFIVNLFKGGFWNVATAIVGLIVPVLALFLVFRLIHGLIYGKGV